MGVREPQSAIRNPQLPQSESTADDPDPTDCPI